MAAQEQQTGLQPPESVHPESSPESRGAPRGTRFVSTVLALVLLGFFFGVPLESGFAPSSFGPMFLGAVVVYVVVCIYFLRDILTYR